MNLGKDKHDHSKSVSISTTVPYEELIRLAMFSVVTSILFDLVLRVETVSGLLAEIVCFSQSMVVYMKNFDSTQSDAAYLATPLAITSRIRST